MNVPESKNQVMMLTPAGAAAIAVMRLSGPGTRDFLAEHFSAKVVAGKPVHGLLRASAGDPFAIDDPVVVISDDSAWADLCLHGGQAIINATIDLAERAGFVAQNAGDAPPCDGSLGDAAIGPAQSLLEAEMLAWLPMARTELALRTLLDQSRAWEEAGALGKELSPANEGSKVSAFDPRAILADRSLWWMLHPPRVAIVGIPNVGKSTLGNQLFGRQRSITADATGTTRDWVGELANINGLAVMLVDTPGIHRADDPLESAAIAASADEIDRSDLLVLVLDASRSLEDQINLRHAWPMALVAINKIDRPHAWDISREQGIQISALTGTGVDELRKRIAAHFGVFGEFTPRPRFWTARQRKILLESIDDPSRA